MTGVHNLTAKIRILAKGKVRYQMFIIIAEQIFTYSMAQGIRQGILLVCAELVPKISGKEDPNEVAA